MPARNGVERADITAFADPKRYPNLALLAFGVIPPEVEETAVNALGNGRLTEDLVSPLVPWLAFIWGAGPNPLLAGTDQTPARCRCHNFSGRTQWSLPGSTLERETGLEPATLSLGS